MVLLSNCGNRHQMMYVYKILPYAPVNNLKAKSTNNTFTAIMLNAYNPCLSIPFVFIYRVYAEVCGLILAFLGSGGRNAATIFSLRKSSSR